MSGRRPSRPAPAARGRWLVVAAALLAAPASASAAPPAAQPRPIALVGIDGGDWLAVDRLVARGELPSFARLRARGRTGVMRATPPLVPPILWTTIATGRRPEDHRVLDFVADLPGGGQAPVTSSERRVAALWNLFSERERTVAVVGWLATWPAESVRGTIVTDRAASRLAEPGAAPDPRAWSPASRATELAKLLVRPQQLTREDLAGYAAITDAELVEVRQALASPPAALYENPLAHLAVTLAGMRSHERLAEALVKPKQPDLLMVYLDGLDALSHRFVRDAKRGPTVIDEAYRDADAFLARLAATLRPETWILVTSAHGFYPKDAGVAKDPAELAGPATAWHRPYGIVAAIEARELRAIAALGTRAPRDAGSVTALDIAPTVLHAAGLAPSLAMPGRVVDTLLPPEAAARPVVRVRSFEVPQREAAPVPATAADPAGCARLVALGSVAAGARSLGRLNLGEILYHKGDYAGAEHELRALVAEQPQNAPALVWLARTVAAQARPQPALELYERALGVEPAGDVLLEAVELRDAQRLERGRASSAGPLPGAGRGGRTPTPPSDARSSPPPKASRGRRRASCARRSAPTPPTSARSSACWTCCAARAGRAKPWPRCDTPRSSSPTRPASRRSSGARSWRAARRRPPRRPSNAHCCSRRTPRRSPSSSRAPTSRATAWRRRGRGSRGCRPRASAACCSAWWPRAAAPGRRRSAATARRSPPPRSTRNG